MNRPRSTTTGTADTALGASDSLALRPREAAKALGIGQRLLWDLTAPRGPIPAVRVGRCILYPVDGLKRWLADQAAMGGQS
jgi:hypothetical protein